MSNVKKCYSNSSFEMKISMLIIQAPLSDLKACNEKLLSVVLQISRLNPQSLQST